MMSSHRAVSERGRAFFFTQWHGSRCSRTARPLIYSYIRIYESSVMLTPAQLCKCLGDDLRLSLICLLHGQGEVCVCDLVAAISAPQSTVSRHLAQLRQCELVVARRQGTWMHYRINPALPDWAIATLESLVAPARASLSLTFSDFACCET